jgi:hypothetical protein
MIPRSGPSLLGNVTAPAGYLPSVVDTSVATIHPLTDAFASPDFPGGRNEIVAVQIGPFARVVNTGSCLNVRYQPSPDALVIGCFSDGVLLRDISHGLIHAGEWVQVVAPGGNIGWASTQYLER